MIDQILDERYRIVRKLGEGGMGEVYLAEHISLGREDALKLLREDLAADAEFVTRFRREARATNRLQHPNIVAVHDFGRLGRRFYLAMELIVGQHLDEVLKKDGPLPWPRALRILAQLADAVDHAHARGVVHRDLKPENLSLVEHRGHKDVLKVLDFGIAKIVKGDAEESVSVSHPGKLYGTPAYMAPEQFGGGVAEPRADIYAIGCIAMALLTGEPPFRGHMLQLLEKHLNEPPERPSARRRAAAIPPELDDVVLRCLAKKPAERFQTGRDLCLALDRLHRAESRSPSGRRSHYGTGSLDPDSDTVGSTTRAPTAGVMSGRTEPISMQVVVRATQEIVRSLAQALADLDGGDARILASLTRLRLLEDDLAWHDAQQSALEAYSDDLEAAARAREASLRFSLGELYYTRGQALSRGDTPDEALDALLAELDGRAAEMPHNLDRELGALTDQAISIAAARHTVEEARDAEYTKLSALVDALLPRFESHPQIAPLAGRLRAVRVSHPVSR